MRKFENKLRLHDWQSIYDLSDHKKSWQLFHETMTRMYELCFPEEITKLNYKNKKIWMSANLKTAAKSKNKLF